MAIPLRQSARVGWYLFNQKLHKREKFPLLVELEPLFACNLKCPGCGKIQQPHDLLRQRMPVERAVAAIEESGAPMVSIAGGEPLMHPQIDVMVAEFVKRKKYVYLCTNAELVRKRWDKFNFKPSPYFAFTIHVDGLRERHDEAVAKEGVFDEAMEAIKFLKERGFRVTTNSTFFSNDTPQNVIDVLNMLNDEVKVDNMMISPAYAYEKAPDQDHFLGVTETRELFKKAFAGGNRKRWRLNHSPLFLDFLEGKVDFECTAWGIPSYSLLGWQRPCYLMADGYVQTYKELVETTDWSKYGRGRDERCNNCMAHCGYEPTAVLATMGSLKQSLRAMREQGLIRTYRGLPGTRRAALESVAAFRARHRPPGAGAELGLLRDEHPRISPCRSGVRRARPPGHSRGGRQPAGDRRLGRARRRRHRGRAHAREPQGAQHPGRRPGRALDRDDDAQRLRADGVPGHLRNRADHRGGCGGAVAAARAHLHRSGRHVPARPRPEAGLHHPHQR